MTIVVMAFLTRLIDDKNERRGHSLWGMDEWVWNGVHHRRNTFFPSLSSPLTFSICRSAAISLSRSEGFI